MLKSLVNICQNVVRSRGFVKQFTIKKQKLPHIGEDPKFFSKTLDNTEGSRVNLLNL